MKIYATMTRGEYFVECEEHSHSRVHFYVSDLDMIQSRLQLSETVEIAATEALKQHCPGCVVAQRKMPETRWPEGAEL